VPRLRRLIALSTVLLAPAPYRRPRERLEVLRVLLRLLLLRDDFRVAMSTSIAHP